MDNDEARYHVTETPYSTGTLPLGVVHSPTPWGENRNPMSPCKTSTFRSPVVGCPPSTHGRSEIVLGVRPGPTGSYPRVGLRRRGRRNEETTLTDSTPRTSLPTFLENGDLLDSKLHGSLVESSETGLMVPPPVSPRRRRERGFRVL